MTNSEYGISERICGGAVVKRHRSARDTGDTGSVPGFGRSPGEGNGNPLQHSSLENPMNRDFPWVKY